MENGTFTVSFLKEGLQKVSEELFTVSAQLMHVFSSEDGWMTCSKHHGTLARAQTS